MREKSSQQSNNILYHVAIRIGFEYSSYSFEEPDRSTSYTISLIKENQRLTEQTFEVLLISFSGTGLDISSGDSYSGSGDSGSGDSEPGDTFDDTTERETYRLTFFPSDQRLMYSFEEYPDDDPEDMEGYQIICRTTRTPSFQPPITSFSITRIHIENDDCKFITNTTGAYCE